MNIARNGRPPRNLSGLGARFRRLTVRALQLGAVLALGQLGTGCGKSGITDEVTAFKDRGHMTSGFADLDPSSFGANKCQTGTVDRLSVLLCQYASGDSASGGQTAAEAWGAGTDTVVVLRRGNVLLAIADRDHADPEGKTISALSKVFRRTRGR